MRILIILFACLIIFPAVIFAQEVVVSGFPKGVGRSINDDFFKPYYNDLQIIAKTLKNNPLAVAIITGGADGETYKIDDDTKNSALALGRAHILRNYFTTTFSVNSYQIIVSTEEVTTKGANDRYASIHISNDSKELTNLVNRFHELDKNDKTDGMMARIEALENQPPIEKHFTEVEGSFKENFGLKVSGGISSSSFGGIPIIGGAVTWESNLFLEAVVGHTFWNNNFLFEDLSLDTKKRLIGGQIIFYPYSKNRVGIIGGWVRIEEISNKFHEYVKMTEGPLMGLRYSPFNNISVTAAFNLSKQRLLTDGDSISNNNQFILSLSFYEILGGGQ